MNYLRLSLMLFLFHGGLSGSAQQHHFIYLQTENRQPFYCKFNKQLLSSSASGYLIIPKLKTGTYELAIGFPKNEWPEQHFTTSVQNSDLGLLVKNFGDKGWGLFNLQTLEVAMSGAPAKVPAAPIETKTDQFSSILSDVVNDPTIKQADPIPEVVKAPTPPPAETPVDSAKTSAVPPVAAAGAIPEVKATPGISRLVKEKGNAGTDLVYVDVGTNAADTIRIFIPGETDKRAGDDETGTAVPVSTTPQDNKQKEEVKNELPKTAPRQQPEPDATTKEKPNSPAPVADIPKETAPADKRFLELDVADTSGRMVQTKTDAVSKKPTTKPAVQEEEIQTMPTPMINSDCKSMASDEDFLRLRKKMVAEDSDDEMITIAKKAFKGKCYSVEQVKNLSVLFLKDAGRYNFFDMAYPFVSDSHNFPGLQRQLSDEYYISRFKAMIRR